MTDAVDAVEWLARRLLSRHVDRDVPADEWETLPEYIREVWRPQAAAALDALMDEGSPVAVVPAEESVRQVEVSTVITDCPNPRMVGQRSVLPLTGHELGRAPIDFARSVRVPSLAEIGTTAHVEVRDVFTIRGPWRQYVEAEEADCG